MCNMKHSALLFIASFILLVPQAHAFFLGGNGNYISFDFAGVSPNDDFTITSFSSFPQADGKSLGQTSHFDNLIVDTVFANAIRSPLSNANTTGIRLKWRKYKVGQVKPGFTNRTIPFKRASLTYPTVDEYEDSSEFVVSPSSDAPGNYILEFRLCAILSNGSESCVPVGDPDYVTMTFSRGAEPPPAPDVTTNAAASITTTSAVLNSQVDANGSSTNLEFRYSVNSDFSSPQFTTTSNIGSGNSPIPWAIPLTGLQPNTTYYFRAEATNPGGFDKGSTLDFKTLSYQESWRLIHFGTTQNTGDAADLTDFDKDGRPNVIEFAFGTDPKDSKSRQLPTWTIEGLVFTTEFFETTSIDSVSIKAEWSDSNLPGTWTTLPDLGTDSTHRFEVTTTGRPRLFARFRVNPL